MIMKKPLCFLFLVSCVKCHLEAFKNLLVKSSNLNLRVMIFQKDNSLMFSLLPQGDSTAG